MNRTGLIIVAVALLAALAGAWVGGTVFAPNPIVSEPASTAAEPMLAVGDRRVDATLIDTAGKERPLSEFDGQPLLINFWATWCPPCIRELPLLDRWHARRASDGLPIVAIALESDLALVNAFVDERKLTLPIRMSQPGRVDLSSRFGNARGVLPYSVLVAADGTVLAQKMGELDEAQLAQWADLAANATAQR